MDTDEIERLTNLILMLLVEKNPREKISIGDSVLFFRLLF